MQAAAVDFPAPGPANRFTTIGFCTDICVISNALLIRAAMPNAKIKIRESCTAGTSEVKEDAAFAIAESNQIDVIYEDME